METYVIHVTKECNCDCVYCYETDKTSTYAWTEIKELIDNIIKYRTSDEFTIEFLGGEPMLAWEHIKQSYEYLESIEEINVDRYCITTNGTIMNDDVADYLSKNNKMHFAVSLDGHKFANQLRVFREGRKNTYDEVMKNISKLKEYNVEASIHMVTHPYNVASISDSIDHLYKQGIRSIDLGTVESTIIIDEKYCDTFISELDLVSQRIIANKYPELSIGLFEWVKPKEDVRSYIIDPVTGKTIAESYGRSGDDLTHSDEYKVNRCTNPSKVGEMIHNIRVTAYNLHASRK